MQTQKMALWTPAAVRRDESGPILEGAFRESLEN
jgi:hypothetical protein